MDKLKVERREFIRYSTLGVFGIALVGGTFGVSYVKNDENRLRPPGALKEDKFLALCIKCGQCLQVCPYDSIRLADFKKGFGIGTPYIDARRRGCYLCGALPCVLACPSGALDHHLQKPQDVHMGIAVFINSKSCFAVNGKLVTKEYIDKISIRMNKTTQTKDISKKLKKFEGKECTICADMCPLPNPLSAISMISNEDNYYPKILDGCVGCGVCEELCPVEISAIVVKPRLSYKEYYEKG